MPRLLCTLLWTTLLCPHALNAQCIKPAVPENGFALTEFVDSIVTYSDGYRAYGDLIYPSATPPSCGWPLVLYVHGLGGSRTSGRPQHRDLAERGFAVWAYDVRGQGDTGLLNSGGTQLTMYGAVEKMDFAEQVSFVRTNFSSLVDINKLGVTGTSQGGCHSWFAAAYEGQAVSVPMRGSVTMPLVDAVVPQHMNVDIHDLFVLGGSLFDQGLFQRVYGNNNYEVDPSFTDQFDLFWLNQDPAGLASEYANEPDRLITPKLNTCTVPIFYQHAYHDQAMSPQLSAAPLTVIPNQTPVRTLHSTIGHDSPFNNYEADLQRESRVFWFDRYLWDIQNEIECEEAWLLGVMPVSGPALFSPTSLWGHRNEEALPVTTTTRYYLNDLGQLSPTPPAGVGTPAQIDHQVASGFTPAVYTNGPSEWSTSNVLAQMPLDESIFSVTLAEQTELIGTSRVRLRASSTAGEFLLSARLSVRLPSADRDFMIAVGGTGVRGATPDVVQDVNIDIPISCVVIPPGSVLKLTIQNHWLRDWPMPRAHVSAPMFTSSATSVQLSASPDDSYVDLPLREPRADIVTATASMAASDPQIVSLQVRGGLAWANRPYAILMSASGHCPPFLIANGSVPLQRDAYMNWVIANFGSPVIPGFLGTLSSEGMATGSFDFDALAGILPSLVGTRISFASWVYTTSGNLTGTGTNAVDLVIR